MKTNFKILNYWEHLTPRDHLKHSGNALKTFLVNYFDKYHFQLLDKDIPEIDNLQFVLMEILTIGVNDLQSVGDTFIYSANSQETNNIINSNYHNFLETINTNGYVPIKNIINNLFSKDEVADKDLLISNFINWYQQTGFYSFLKNNVQTNSRNKILTPSWSSLPLGSDSIIKSNELELKEQAFIKYLNEYNDKVYEIVNASQYPYFLTIILPIALMDEESQEKPIGNIFLHIGLNNALSDIQISNFICLLLLIWLKKNWTTIFKNFERPNKTVQQQFDPKHFYIDISNINKSFNFPKHNINQFLEKFYENDHFNNGSLFVNNLKSKDINVIFEALFNIRAKKADVSIEFSNYLNRITVSRFTKMEINDYDNTKAFIYIHIIIKSALLIFDFPIEVLVEILKSNTIFEKTYLSYDFNVDNFDTAYTKTFLQADRLIYCGKHQPKHKAQILENVKKSSSKFEINLLKSTAHIIERFLEFTDNEIEKNILFKARQKIATL